MYSEARDTLSRYLRGSEDHSVAGEVWNAPGSGNFREEGGMQSFDELFREGPVTLHGMKLGFSSPGREAGPAPDPGDSPLDDGSSTVSGTLDSAGKAPSVQAADGLNSLRATGRPQGNLWRMLATTSRRLRLSGFRSQTSRLGAAGTPSLVRRGRALAEEFGRETISEGEEASEEEDWTLPSYKAYASCDLGSIGAGGGRVAERLEKRIERERLWGVECESAQHGSLDVPKRLGSLPPEAALFDEYRALLEVPSLGEPRSGGEHYEALNRFYRDLHRQWSADPL